MQILSDVELARSALFQGQGDGDMLPGVRLADGLCPIDFRTFGCPRQIAVDKVPHLPVPGLQDLLIRRIHAEGLIALQGHHAAELQTMAAHLVEAVDQGLDAGVSRRVGDRGPQGLQSQVDAPAHFRALAGVFLPLGEFLHRQKHVCAGMGSRPAALGGLEFIDGGHQLLPLLGPRHVAGASAHLLMQGPGGSLGSHQVLRAEEGEGFPHGHPGRGDGLHIPPLHLLYGPLVPQGQLINSIRLELIDGLCVQGAGAPFLFIIGAGGIILPHVVGSRVFIDGAVLLLQGGLPGLLLFGPLMQPVVLAGDLPFPLPSLQLAAQGILHGELLHGGGHPQTIDGLIEEIFVFQFLQIHLLRVLSGVGALGIVSDPQVPELFGVFIQLFRIDFIFGIHFFQRLARRRVQRRLVGHHSRNTIGERELGVVHEP